jgi:hypothetical protein
MIHEACKSKASRDARKKAQLTIAYDSHLGIIYFELAFLRAIVTPSAKTQEAPSLVDVARDAPVALAV